MRWSTRISLGLLAAAVLSAGPVEFGQAEFQAALAARNLKTKIDTEINLDPPESFSITTYQKGGARVAGGDLRGLMYGLLEAADQIRATGKLKLAHGGPFIAVRGVRLTPTAPYDFSDARWRPYFQMLARSRVNRVTVALPLADAHIGDVKFLSQLASDYAVDFTLAIGAAGGDPLPVHKGLRTLLDACPMIRGIEMDPGYEPVSFFSNSVFPALRETGRRVTFDLRGADVRPDVAQAGQQFGIVVQNASALEKDAPGMEGNPMFYFSVGRVGYDPKAVQ